MLTAYDDPATTAALTARDRQAAREHAVAVGEHISELGHPGPKELVMADLYLLAERVIRLVDQIERMDKATGYDRCGTCGCSGREYVEGCPCPEVECGCHDFVVAAAGGSGDGE